VCGELLILGKSVIRHTQVSLPACFEYSLPPSERFLLWLIERVGEECKPRKGLRQEQLIAGRRADLFGDDATLRQEAQREAIRSLMLHGPRASRNQWWALEGFTSVDCYLETSDMVLLIEGKRTESVSLGTDWCATRNQIARNLEAARNAAQGRRYAVLLLGEQQTPVGREEIVAGLPHMTELESSFLSQHYLGCVTWQQVCKASCLTIDLNRELADVRMAEKWLRNRGYMAKLGE